EGGWGGGGRTGKAEAPEDGVVGEVPHVTAERQLGAELGGECDPTAERAHHPLLGVAIVADAAGRRLDGEAASQRVIAHDGPVSRQESAACCGRACRSPRR